ncbi:MAG: spore maturation protein [Verrucomicrobia bacterium]|nr:spore maturation protein [Verrucomicrobiota bacterium]
MLNYIWLGLVLFGVLAGGFSAQFPAVVDGAIEGAKNAVTLALGLIGIMALWLGVMRLAELAGLVRVIARGLRPVLRRLFPDVPEEHPAMGSMVLNIAANMLGLTNAATPLGLRAMRDLETLNRVPGTATNAMCTFLAINTSSVQLIPMTAVAVLAASGSTQPSAIIGTAFLATLCSTAVGLSAVKLLERLPAFRLPAPTHLSSSSATGNPPSPPLPSSSENEDAPAPAVDAAGLEPRALSVWSWTALAALLLAFAGFWLVGTFPQLLGSPLAPEGGPPLARAVNTLSLLAIPFLLSFILLYAALRGVQVYEQFVEGAREGFQVAIRIIPYLVAMLVAIGVFRGGGGLDLLAKLFGPMLGAIGFPTELLPMALIRPLTGTGTLAIFSDLVATHGPDSLIARTAGTVFGSTETTFYVVALYFGSVAVRRTRHAIPAGLIADATGVIAAVVICRWVFA